MAVNRPALVQTRESANQMEVVIVEPTQKRGSLTVTIEGSWKVKTADSHVDVSCENAAGTLHVDTAGLGGQSVRVTLARQVTQTPSGGGRHDRA